MGDVIVFDVKYNTADEYFKFIMRHILREYRSGKNPQQIQESVISSEPFSMEVILSAMDEFDGLCAGCRYMGGYAERCDYCIEMDKVVPIG